MPRVPARDRLIALVEAATTAFGRQGYRGTRMADVATAAGVSSGLVFTYVESKEALFHSVFAYGFGQYDEAMPALPVPTPSPGETVALIEENLRKVQVPQLRAAFDVVAPEDIRAELRGVVLERYDMVAGFWPLLAVIERCANDLPDLEAFYFQGTRVAYFNRLTRYMGDRMAAGYLRRMDPALAARIVNESISWFAWKRHEGRDARLYDNELVRTTVVDFICNALVEQP